MIIQSKARITLTKFWSYTFTIIAPILTFRYARTTGITSITLIAGAYTWGIAYSIFACIGTICFTGFSSVWRMDVSLIARADSGPLADAVGATTLALRLAVLRLVEEEARVAATLPGRHAVPVPAVVEADRPTDAVARVLVAELAVADLRREAVGVLLAPAPAHGLALIADELPAVLARANIRAGAGSTHAAAIAVRLALARVVVAQEAVAAAHHRHPASNAARFHSFLFRTWHYFNETSSGIES